MVASRWRFKMLTLNFAQIKNSKEPLTHIECEVQPEKEFLKRSQNLVYQVKNIKLSGAVFYNQPYVTGDFHVVAQLVVPSSRSLEPVDFQEDFHFSENYTDTDVAKEESAESEIPIVKVENEIIDLQKAIEDNILLHIPTTILTKKEEQENLYPRGKGWSVISEDDFVKEQKEQVNPAFAKLKDLFTENNKNLNNENKNN